MSVARCTCCKHAKREALDAALVRGESQRAVASQFGVSPAAVDRHRSHIAKQVAKREKATTRTLESLLDKSHRQLDDIIERNLTVDDGIATKALKERGALASLEFGRRDKITVAIDEPDDVTDAECVKWLRTRGWKVSPPT